MVIRSFALYGRFSVADAELAKLIFNIANIIAIDIVIVIAGVCNRWPTASTVHRYAPCHKQTPCRSLSLSLSRSMLQARAYELHFHVYCPVTQAYEEYESWGRWWKGSGESEMERCN